MCDYNIPNSMCSAFAVPVAGEAVLPNIAVTRQ
jgi:hypothetical protein